MENDNNKVTRRHFKMENDNNKQKAPETSPALPDDILDGVVGGKRTLDPVPKTRQINTLHL